MNIEQYRALKAQEEANKDSTQQPAVEQPKQPEVIPETKPEEKPIESKPVEVKEEPLTVEINGEKLTLEELKNGYLRQSDYTKKTQEVAKQREETKEAVAFYEYLKQNPQIAEQLKQNGGQVPDRIDPSLSKVKELEEKMYDMMLEREIETLSNKYEDFDVREVLEVAGKKGITNLEDAYLIVKANKPSNNSPTDMEELKKQLREELLKEIQQEKDATQTIISTNTQAVPTTSNLPNLNKNELKVASMMKLSPEEYIKWRDIDKKKK